MRLEDLTNKTAYCIRMMRLARWMAKGLAQDHDRRVVGRMVLVFAVSYIDNAFALIRQPGLPPEARARLKNQVRMMRRDLEQRYADIRHDLTAHRDDLPLDETIAMWNEIDVDTLDWFVSAAEESFAAIVGSHPHLTGAVIPFDSEANTQLAQRLGVDAQSEQGLRMSTDALALTRGEISMIPAHEVQDRMSVLMSIWDTLGVCARVMNVVAGDPPSFLLLKSLMVIDTINLVDGVFGPVTGGSKERSSSLLEILERGNFGGAQLLRAASERADIEAIDEIRRVRNRGCAHLDTALTLPQIIDLIADLDNDLVVGRVLLPTWTSVEEACAADMTTRWLVLDTRTLSDLRPASTPGVRAFDPGDVPS